MQLYSYTMQFANRLPFSQHFVPRYNESLAPLNFSIWGTAKKIFVPQPCTKFPLLSASSEGLHLVSYTNDLLLSMYGAVAKIDIQNRAAVPIGRTTGLARPSVCLSVRLSVCPSVCLSVRLSVRLSVCLSVCPSVRPSVCLSAGLSVPISKSKRHRNQNLWKRFEGTSNRCVDFQLQRQDHYVKACAMQCTAWRTAAQYGDTGPTYFSSSFLLLDAPFVCW